MTNALWHLDCYKGQWNIAVDVGAYIAEFSIAAAQRGARVYAYEASPWNYEIMKANPEWHENITAYNLAVVGSANGDWFSNGAGPVAKTRPYIEGMKVQTISLADVVRAHDPVDFLKIDIEGGEHEMFSRRDQIAKVLQQVRFLQLEIHPRDGFLSNQQDYQHQINELISFLQRCGFKDKPCIRRQQHAGDFCSHNHRFF